MTTCFADVNREDADHAKSQGNIEADNGRETGERAIGGHETKGRELPRDDVLFSIDAVSYSVAGRTLLHPLTLDLCAGRMIALIGHNGSGKSTLLNILARQRTASTGTIRFIDTPLAQWPTREFAQRVGYLPQHPAQGTDLTVRELVMLGRYPWHGALGRLGKDDHALVDQAIEATDMGRFASHLVDTLSGGERQRAWIAMLIAQKASCLLLDEPTSALDIAHQIEVLQLLRRLADAERLTIVIVMHDFNLAARFCDEMIALRQGKLLAAGSPQLMMKRGMLESIYGIPMDILQDSAGRHCIGVPR